MKQLDILTKEAQNELTAKGHRIVKKSVVVVDVAAMTFGNKNGGRGVTLVPVGTDYMTSGAGVAERKAKAAFSAAKLNAKPFGQKRTAILAFDLSACIEAGAVYEVEETDEDETGETETE